MVLHNCYAMCGAKLAYGATPMLCDAWCALRVTARAYAAMRGTETAYAAMSAVCDVRMLRTDGAYGATRVGACVRYTELWYQPTQHRAGYQPTDLLRDVRY
eukprot:2969036-Rhodomonas_salina.2